MSFMDELASAIGKNDAPTKVKTWLNTGHPLLNDAISGSYHGGLPVGRMVEMFGPPSCGKTAIATEAMICAQRMGGVAMFFDHENSFDVGLAESMGLDPNGRWVFKAPDTFEQSVHAASKAARHIREKGLIDPKAPIIVVFDSLASMVPRSKMEKEVDEHNMNDKLALPAATSAAFPVLAKMSEKDQWTPMFLNQIRDNVSGYGEKHKTPGGNAPEFYASVRIALKRTKKTKGTGSTKVINGQTIEAEVVKNKVHRPFERCKWDFMFTETGEGKFDPVGSVLDHLIDLNILERKGARVTWEGKSLYRDDIVARIEETGDRLALYSLLPNWEADRAASTSVIDWNLA
ncbi:MAG: hypothetical protein LPK02_07400 [Rhodobacterales bacterium]|nr:hypothetical protein [Rhodobacterales bacterium]